MVAKRTSWLVLLAGCSSPDLSAPAPIGTEPSPEPEVQAFTLSPEPTVEPPIAVYDASPPAPVETTEQPDPEQGCAPADCNPSPGINCDPACGPVSMACGSECSEGPTLDFGVTYIRTPPVTSLWTLRVRIPDQGHMLVVSPYGISRADHVYSEARSTVPPALNCEAREWRAGLTCGAFGGPLDGSFPRDHFLELALEGPSAGARFTVTLFDHAEESPCRSGVMPSASQTNCNGHTP